MCYGWLYLQFEFAHYLEDFENDLLMLNMYPYVEQLVLKYNTKLPPSAPVERLYSFGGIIRSAKRNKLSDNMFETLLFFKANAHINYVL
jgi:hypothetical protein